jgi:hypothetical protein
MYKPKPCPHCGVAMWLELGKTVVRHPSGTDCAIGGSSFRVKRRSERDRRMTWDEYCAKNARREATKMESPKPESPKPPPSAGPEIPE